MTFCCADTHTHTTIPPPCTLCNLIVCYLYNLRVFFTRSASFTQALGVWSSLGCYQPEAPVALSLRVMIGKAMKLKCSL